jgi:hypothetical protein
MSTLIDRPRFGISDAETMVIHCRFTLLARRVIAVESLALNAPRIRLFGCAGRRRADRQCAAKSKYRERQTHRPSSPLMGVLLSTLTLKDGAINDPAVGG